MTGSQVLEDLVKALCFAAVLWLGLLTFVHILITQLPTDKGRSIVDTIDELTFGKLYPTGEGITSKDLH